MLTLLVLSGGCPAKNIGPELRVTVAPQVVGEDCSAPEGGLTSLANLARLRTTVRIRDASGGVSAVCDQVAQAPLRMPPPFNLVVPAGGSLDYFVEAFAGDDTNGYQRIASGARLGLRSGAAVAEPLRLVEAERFRCVGRQQEVDDTQTLLYSLRYGRAFHSATLLPGGLILLVGGLSIQPDGGNAPSSRDSYFVHGRAEIYDSVRHRFINVTEALPQGVTAPLPRAFHNAVVLADSTADAIRVLLVGGLSTDLPNTPVMRTNTVPVAGFFRLELDPNISLLQPPAEILTYNPQTQTITRQVAAGLSALPSAAYQAAVQLPGSGSLLLGGGTLLSPAGISDNLSADEVLANGQRGGTATLSERHYAPALVATGSDTAVLIGGNDGMASLLVALSPPLQGSLTSVSVPGVPALWFPTAVSFPGMPSPVPILIAGGLENGSNGAVQPYAQPPLRVSLSGGSVSFGSVALPANFNLGCGPARDHFRAAAWSSATVLRDGTRALVSGGTPRTVCPTGSAGPADCEGGENVLSCPIHQAAVYDATNNNVAPLPAAVPGSEGLQLARWGHTQTLLADGTVLVVGGFTRRGGLCSGGGQVCAGPADCGGGTCNGRQTTGTLAVEIYNPARRDPVLTNGLDPDDPVFDELRALGNVAREPGQQAHRTGSTLPSHSCPLLQ